MTWTHGPACIGPYENADGNKAEAVTDVPEMDVRLGITFVEITRLPDTLRRRSTLDSACLGTESNR